MSKNKPNRDEARQKMKDKIEKTDVVKALFNGFLGKVDKSLFGNTNPYNEKNIAEFKKGLKELDKEALQRYDKGMGRPILTRIIGEENLTKEQLKSILPALKKVGVNFNPSGLLDQVNLRRDSQELLPVLVEQGVKGGVPEALEKHNQEKVERRVVAEKKAAEAAKKKNEKATKDVLDKFLNKKDDVSKEYVKRKLRDKELYGKGTISNFSSALEKADRDAIREYDVSNKGPILTRILNNEKLTPERVTELLPKLSEAGVSFTPETAETPPLVQVAEAWKKNEGQKNIKDVYLELAKRLVINGAHADVKGKDGQNIFKIVPAEHKAELRTALIEAQKEIGQKIRANHTKQSAIEDAKNVAKRMANFLSKHTVKKKVFEVNDTQRDVLRKQQKAAGRAIRGGRW
ncbi:MAG: hypothetical protein N4A31_02905 [Rickettsiales bacterium]|jgi:hypothetical protein|nr:hypothetical protein [Rickettsiales bacterium]